jgi:hypothetical protein
MIEAHLCGKDPWLPWRSMKRKHSKLFREEVEEYGDLPEQIKILMEGYFRWYKKDPLRFIPLKRGGKKAEHELKVQLTPRIILGLKIDAIGVTKDKLRWLIDHKSHKTIPTGDLPYTDIQTMLYCWALEQENFKVDGVAWNYIRVKTPTLPQPLKAGGLSKAKSIDTTWGVYKSEIKRLGLKLSDYKDMKELLIDKEADFYTRLYMPINRTLMNNLKEEMTQAAREMIAEKPPIRNIERHCDWCEFKNLCQGELRGLDVNWIRKNEYQEKGDGKRKKKKTAT